MQVRSLCLLTFALPSLAALGPPGSIDVLRSAVSAAGVAIGCRPWVEQDAETTFEQTLRVAALTPVLTAALYRLARCLAADLKRHPHQLDVEQLGCRHADVGARRGEDAAEERIVEAGRLVLRSRPEMDRVRPAEVAVAAFVEVQLPGGGARGEPVGAGDLQNALHRE